MNFLSNLKPPWSSFQSKISVGQADSLPLSTDISPPKTDEKIKLIETNAGIFSGDTERPSHIANKVFGMAMKASSKLQEKATNISAMVNERTIIGNIEKERQKFMEELCIENKCVDDFGLNELLANAEAQQHIISISSSPRNFTEEPPLTVDLGSNIALVKTRAEALFKLDPRVSEEKFWRNYAYRLSLVRKFVNENHAQCCATETTDKSLEKGVEQQRSTETKIEPVENDDEEKLEKELLNDLDEFEVVDDGKRGAGEDEKIGGDLDKQLDELLDCSN
uniref:BSD domain-containing protein n=1 Tax=Globodera rostochiensis TaxID=31243 RepID=A0A914HDR1_GLORO